MTAFTPNLLPEIVAVDVVDLAGVGYEVDQVSDYMAAATDAHHVRLCEGEADRIATLWRSLAPGEEKRCHLPPFGLRFYAESGLVCRASICWRCNNIYGETGRHPFRFEFEGSELNARSLLASCERALGHTAAGE